MKGNNEVIKDFNNLVNMTAEELETWLKSDKSGEAGWSKDDNSGETIGHDSGHKITEILKSNPSKDPKKYTEKQIAHMRKVAAYCKRHLAQEKSSLESKSPNEAKNTKSYISLKNWGHDYLKGNEKQGQGEEDEPEAGDKRKRDNKGGAKPKKRTRQSNTNNSKGKGDEAEGEEDGEENSADEQNDSDSEDNSDAEEDVGAETDEKSGSKSKKNKSTSKNGPKPGETVSWNWGNGQPRGKVLDVKDDKATITTKRGSKVSRDGEPDDPAVILDTGNSKGIKLAHELN